MWPGPIFCLFLRVSSDYAQPITGQVTEVTCHMVGRAQSALTPSKRQKMALMSISPLGMHMMKSQIREWRRGGLYESRTHNDQRNVGRLTKHVAVKYQFEWGYGLSIFTHSLINEKGWDGKLFCLLPLHRSPLRFRVNESSVWYSLRLSRSDARFMSICLTSLN